MTRREELWWAVQKWLLLITIMTKLLIFAMNESWYCDNKTSAVKSTYTREKTTDVTIWRRPQTGNISCWCSRSDRSRSPIHAILLKVAMSTSAPVIDWQKCSWVPRSTHARPIPSLRSLVGDWVGRWNLLRVTSVALQSRRQSRHHTFGMV